MTALTTAAKGCEILSLSLMDTLAREVAAIAQAGAPDDWRLRGREIKLIDGTSVSMPDTAANQAAFPQNCHQRPGLGFPQARIVGVISLATGCVSHWTVSACEGCGSHEILHLWRLRDSFQAADVVIADRAYGSYFLLPALHQRGVDCVMREHQRRKDELGRAVAIGVNEQRLIGTSPNALPGWTRTPTLRCQIHSPCAKCVTVIGSSRPR